MSGYNPSQRRPDGAALAMAGLLAALGLVILWDAARLHQTGGYAGVGPGDVARWIGFALLGLAVWSGIAAFRERPVPPPRQDAVPVLWVAAGMAAQILLLKTAGFVLATGLLFAFTARGFGKRNLALTVPVGIVFALVVYLVFAGLLKLTLPAGPLEHVFWKG
jgi:putative tricarboxylic transport membrane protein